MKKKAAAQKSTYLINGSDFDTLDNLCLHFLSAVFVQFGLIARDLALVDLAQKPHHVCVQHGREEICMKCRMSKPLLQFVRPSIRTLRVNLGSGELVGRRDVIAECRIKDTVDVYFESGDDQHRRQCRNPGEGFESIL